VVAVPSNSPKTGIVLSGGGMRGAYEVGVVLGIAEVLGRRATDKAMFQVLAGTSVGAINAAFFAANSHYGDHGVAALREVWTGLNLKDHAHVRPLGLLRWPRALRRFRDRVLEDGRGNSLLDTSALEEVVRRSVDWQKLHENVNSGVVSALLIAALHVVSGRTTVFAELSRNADYAASRDQRRAVRYVQIEADHVLASAAIPLLFPTRRVGDQYYSDGGLRFNTPIAPAIRAGAERIVVISVMRERSTSEAELVESMAPPGRGRDLSPIFLVGKLLNALLLDPVLYDLQVLERFNQLMSVLEQALPPEQMQRVQNVLAGSRGIGYRRLRTLIFTPSQDLGKLAGRYLRTALKLTDLNPFAKYLLRRAASEDPAQEADWASYLLFDGGFAAGLIEIGRNDAHAKADEIKSFFAE
jgi:NTE family protein